MKTFSVAVFSVIACVALASFADAETPAVDADKAKPKRISFAFVNDIHGQLEPHPELFWSDDDAQREHRAGGLSRIATAMDQLQSERPQGMLKIDGGDTFQGSGPAAWTKGEAMVDPLNALNLDFAIPGNWSVVYGTKQFQKLSSMVNYPMIAANILDEATGELVFEPYLVKEINGVKIGLLGFTDPDVPTRQPPHMSEGWTFQQAEVLQPLIDKLRNTEKVDVVVLVSHIGLHRAVPLTSKLQGVDVHLSADTHERTYEPIEVGDAWVVEAGAFGTLVGVLDLVVADGKIVDRNWELIELREKAFPESPEVKKTIDEVLEPHRERMNREIGHTDIWLERYNVMSTSMDRLIADAVKESAKTEVGLSNGYRFSPPTAPGPITEADLWNWLPIVLDLKVGTATGQQFMDYWENEFENVFSSDPERLYGGWLARPSTNMDVEFNSTDPAGERLLSLKVDGKPIDPARSYTLAAGARAGQPDDQIHRMKHCKSTETLDRTTHDAVRNYLSKHSDILDTGKAPLHCVVRPDVLRSQYLAFIKERNEHEKNKEHDKDSETDE
ncbi:bifunctional metallophosphatase/5'-nucleotidase [Neorhodopirellula lusitana]|uniref:bifunctional metallophosphatase/5'-nucleotidase n=1 Tax=Neorhodopirellula lusitana TaxID=445327 RepID=UPI00384B6E9B